MRKKPPTKIDITGSIQMHAGVWYALDSEEITECCDCGLVHVTEYMFENGRLFWRSRTNTRATNAARKREGITVLRHAARD